MRIWVDLENTPHVLILKPIIEELQRRHHEVLITARDCSQTIELANYFKLNAQRISHHHGKKTIYKILGHCSRIVRLMWYSYDKGISVALSHGSRSQIIAAGLLRIPTFVMWDYEYASLSVIYHFIDRLAIPEILSADAFTDRIPASKILKYPGIKENIYVANLINNGVACPELQLDQRRVIVTIRPPATEAHYYHHDDGSDSLFYHAIRHLSQFDNTTIVVLARTKAQQQEILQAIQRDGVVNKIVFPPKAQNGIQLIWNSDIVISGGGTMNREAAVLNVPVYSIFQGKIGAIDRYLHQIGRLKIIQSIQDLKSIQPVKRIRPERPQLEDNRGLVNFIVDRILETGVTGK